MFILNQLVILHYHSHLTQFMVVTLLPNVNVLYTVSLRKLASLGFSEKATWKTFCKG